MHFFNRYHHPSTQVTISRFSHVYCKSLRDLSSLCFIILSTRLPLPPLARVVFVIQAQARFVLWHPFNQHTHCSRVALLIISFFCPSQILLSPQADAFMFKFNRQEYRKPHHKTRRYVCKLCLSNVNSCFIQPINNRKN